MTQTPTLARGSLPSWLHAFKRHRGLIVPIGFVMLLAVLLVPLPSAMLDVLIALNIALSIIILLTTVYMAEPLDFSVFPSLLLAATLFRLVLNIASTRLILTADATTPEEALNVAGHVISAFGNFVAGDSLFVGVVLFIILVIVQFIVVSKGASRISEVAARFTLDAMPGKQMAIDSDLNAGIIDDKEAKRRRQRISQEADFFGAMDGASKFVRGDAIAGLIVTVVNILGGFAVGIVQKGWEAGQTAEVFTKLTIGDGLTSQIPSLVVAIASALIVTRSGSKAQLGDELADQLVSQPRGLVITAGFLVLLSLTPLPSVPLIGSAAGLLLIAWTGRRTKQIAAQAAADLDAHAAAKPAEPPPVESLLKIDTLELELGQGLVHLVNAKTGGDMLDRISAVRRNLAAEIGLVMPPVRIRDNPLLETNAYRLKIRGNIIAEGDLRPGRLLAMDPGLASGPIDGEETIEPAFGLRARWIEPALRVRAETMNYTVIEPTAVLATHITELVKKHADELLTRDEVGNLLEQLKPRAAKLIEETVPAILKATELQRLLQNLLRERVPVRDLETVLETVAEWGPKTKDLDVLTEYVRNALRRTICTQYATPASTPGGKPKLLCVTLDPGLEDQINAYIDRGPSGTIVSMPARVATLIAERIAKGLRLVTDAGSLPVVISSPQVRAVVRQVLDPVVSGAAVLGYNEIAPGVEVESLALITPPSETPASPKAELTAA